MKTLFTILLILLSQFYNIAFGQITFQKTYGGNWHDGGYSVQQTMDGGYIVVGNTASFGAGDHDVFLVRTDANGDTLWTRAYGGPNYDFGYSVQQTNDGGFIVTGSTISFGSGIEDVYLLKVDTNGNLQWSKTFGGSSVDVGYSVEQTNDSGYIIVGKAWDFGTGNVYLIKTDSTGNILWTKTYGDNNAKGGYSVHQTNDNGFIFLAEFITGNNNVYVIKTNSSGNVLWAKNFEGDFGYWIEQTMDGGYILTGRISTFGAGINDIFLYKLDGNGNLLWAKTYGESLSEFGYSVQETTDGGFIITGETTSFGTNGTDIYLIKTDSVGNVEWSKIYGESGVSADMGRSIRQTNDNGFIITGLTQINTTGIWDLFLFKTDSNGNSGCTEVSVNTIAMSFTPQMSNQTPSVAGGGTSINPSTIISNVNTSIQTLGIPNAYFSFYNDSTLSVLFSDLSINAMTWYWDFGDGNNDSTQSPFHIYTDTGNYNVCLIVTNNCGSDTYCQNLTIPSSISGIIETGETHLLKSYPNPFVDFLIIEFENRKNKKHTLILYNTKGQLVRHINNITSGQIRITREILTNGLYFFQLRNDTEIIGNGKFIIE